VEQIWRDFKDRPFQALALELWTGPASLVRGFVEATAITFPILMQAGYLQASYLSYDNYVVIDADGIVRYTSAGEPRTSLGPFNEANVRAAIGRYLPTPLESPTWSQVKELYWADGPP
jgi:hypothetical protein